MTRGPGQGAALGQRVSQASESDVSSRARVVPIEDPPRTNVNPDKEGERYDISTRDRARILALNQEDAKLYDRVSEVFHS